MKHTVRLVNKLKKTPFATMSALGEKKAPGTEDASQSVQASTMVLIDRAIPERTSAIVQIAAICGDSSFNIYMSPSGRFTEEASRVTVSFYEGGIMKRHGQTLEMVSAEEGLNQFVDYLATPSKPFLIVHNIQNSDVPILLYNLLKFDLVRNFQDKISGFFDTYELSKKVFDKETVLNYKQETLVKAVLGLDFDAHNAMSDVISLKALYERKLATV